MISAGDTFTYRVHSEGYSSYSFRLTDNSAVDIGFASGGNRVAYHSNVGGARDGAELNGDYDFEIHCRNAFADCDGIIDAITSTY